MADPKVIDSIAALVEKDADNSAPRLHLADLLLDYLRSRRIVK